MCLRIERGHRGPGLGWGHRGLGAERPGDIGHRGPGGGGGGGGRGGERSLGAETPGTSSYIHKCCQYSISEVHRIDNF